MSQKQHWVSQAQLKRFLPAVAPNGEKSGQLHVYSKLDGYRGQQPIANLAQEEDAHSGELEEEMSKLEGWAGRTLAELCEHESSIPGRGPEVQLERFRRVLDLFALTALRGPERVGSFAQEEGVNAETAQNILLRKAVPYVAEALKKLHWCVLTFTEPTVQAVISDAPGVISFPAGIPNVDEWTVALMPITPNRFLVGAGDLPTFLSYLENIHELNALIVEKAMDQIYCSTRDDEYLRYLVGLAQNSKEAKRLLRSGG